MKTDGHAEPLQPNVDQLQQWRDRCLDHVTKWKDELDKCNERVLSRKKTDESCHQEMVDFVHELDHCAMIKAFKALK